MLANTYAFMTMQNFLILNGFLTQFLWLESEIYEFAGPQKVEKDQKCRQKKNLICI